MLNPTNSYFNLYSNCIIVKGYSKSLIIDYCDNNYFFIPNTLSDLLNKLNQRSVSAVKEIYNNEFNREIDTFCNNLVLKDKGFYYCKKSNFPKLNTSWVSPYNVTNVVVEADEKNNYNTLKLLKTDCLGINLSQYNLNSIGLLNSISQSINHNSLQLCINSELKKDTIQLLITSFKKLSHIYLLGFERNNVEQLDGVMIIYTKIKLYVIKNEFTINIPLYSESQKHNTFFNRKLYIGSTGEIKNAALVLDVFGNINELNNTSDILDIINTKAFQKYWYAHKGLIDVCKQCEFRHMCVDNRIPIKRNVKSWYFETECNYNPYIAKWQDEAGYKTLAECGIQSNADGFKINRKKLNAINKELWGDD